MELTGTLHAMLDTETFTLRNGGEMKKRVIVLEYAEGQYPKKAAFVCQVDSVLGFIETLKNKIGSTVNVKFNIESREWNGKWFTDLKIWRMELVGGTTDSPIPSEPEISATQAARQSNQDSHPTHDPDYQSDLPF